MTRTAPPDRRGGNPARRLVLGASGTLASLVLLFGYHTSLAGPAGAVATTAPGLGAGTSTAGAASSGSAHAERTASGGGRGGPGGPGGGGSGRNGSGTTHRPTTQRVTGDAQSTPYGPVQVKVTLEDGVVTHVGLAQYPWSDPNSQQISSYALPTLVRETLAARVSSVSDVARVDMVSGATFTSDGYLGSLQSALDRAGA